MKFFLNLSAAAMLAGCAFGQHTGDSPPDLEFDKFNRADARRHPLSRPIVAPKE
jgi:hypothetical protein